jgi:ABC-2 type transport system permease protein
VTRGRTVALVARREVTSRMRERSFLISTSITILLLLAVGIIPAVFADDGPRKMAVVAVGPEAQAIVAAAARGDAALDLDVRARRAPDERAARRLLEDGTADAAVVDGRIVSEGELDQDLGVLLQQAHAALRRAAALAGSDLTAAQRRDALAPPPLEERSLDPNAAEDAERQGIASLVSFLLYGQLLIYGYWIANGVVEEKSSRVVEVLLAAIRPRQLLTGKVLGLGVLGFVQLLLVALIGAGTVVATGALDVPGAAWEAVGVVMAFFVLGYALYAALFAVAGAVVQRQEDLQSSTMPLTIIIIVSFFGALTASGDPGGQLARVLTFVPPCTPMVLPVRLLAGGVPAWEVVVAVALMVLTAAALIAAAVRIYTNAILRTGGRVRVLDAWRSG